MFKPFLVEGVGIILRLLNRLSPFEYLLRVFAISDKEAVAALTEAWVLSNLLAACLSLAIVAPSATAALRWVATVYAANRIIEIVVFQAYTQLYGGYRNKTRRLHYQLLSYSRSIFLAVILYFEVLIWFASLYRVNSTAFHSEGRPLSDPVKALYYSTVTMTTIGYGDVYPQLSRGFLMVMAQGVIAVFMTILIIARIVTYLPRPRTADPFERGPQDPDEL